MTRATIAHGVFPREYISNPNICKPLEEIYRDLDSFTWELFESDPDIHDNIDITVVLPPLLYEGRLVKGLFFSRGVDFLNNTLPVLRDLFLSMANSMFCSYPWAEAADAVMACYRNPAREAWFRRQHPERAQTQFVPLANSDFVDEYRISPLPGLSKDIDVLCVSRLQDVKNVAMIARALKIFRSKYRRRIKFALVTGHRDGVSPEQLPPYAREQLEVMRQILGRVEDFIDLYGYVEHWTELRGFYTRARVYVLASLIEGKNRSLNEALSCNVPVVHFREFNQYARQGQPVIPEGSGLSCHFDPESFADTIHAVLENPGEFSPRVKYLKRNGRYNFLNLCLDSINYYRSNLPEFVSGQHVQNPWLIAALHANYQRELHSFLYRPGPGVARAWGIENIRRLIDLYRIRLGV